jgi:hypothetical protein
MNLTITRNAYHDFGTFGEFSMPDGMTLYTVERPWLGNQVKVSCIPVGSYVCKPRYYNRGGYKAVEVCDVRGRTYILFHRGNFVRNSRGCILINSGIQSGDVGLCGELGGSGRAFDAFMDVYGGGFDLSIVNYEGGILPEMRRAA